MYNKVHYVQCFIGGSIGGFLGYFIANYIYEEYVQKISEEDEFDPDINQKRLSRIKDDEKPPLSSLSESNVAFPIGKKLWDESDFTRFEIEYFTTDNVFVLLPSDSSIGPGQNIIPTEVLEEYVGEMPVRFDLRNREDPDIVYRRYFKNREDFKITRIQASNDEVYLGSPVQ